jgi:hypothetical protein
VVLGAALAVSLIATIVKFGDRSQMGAVLLATSLVADLQLAIAALIWAWAAYASEFGVTGVVLSSVVSRFSRTRATRSTRWLTTSEQISDASPRKRARTGP